jgi:hypothetical protein
MIHIYQEAEKVKTSLIAVAPLTLVVIAALGIRDFTLVNIAIGAGVIGLVLGLVKVIGKWSDDRTCTEIRLSDDGTCELQMKHRVIRLHVVQIRSVQYASDSETGREHYTIRFVTGKAVVSDRMADFDDFLTRLKSLNPTADLRSFPARRWPGLNAPEVDGGTNLVRIIRSALFPVSVIGLIIYLAVQTLTSG